MDTIAQTPAIKRRLRNYLLDARFQLKFALYILVISLVLAGLLGAFLWQSARVLLRETEAAVEARSRAADASRALSVALLNSELLARMHDPSFNAQLKEKSGAIDAGFDAERKAVLQQREELGQRQRLTWFVLAGCLVAFILFTTLATIVVTHRVAGPLMRIKRILAELASGRLPASSRKLRNGDELQDLFDETLRMVQTLRDQHTVDSAQVQKALAQLRKEGVSQEALMPLLALESDLKARQSEGS